MTMRHTTGLDGPLALGFGLAGSDVERLAALGRVWGFLKYHHPNLATAAIDSGVAGTTPTAGTW